MSHILEILPPLRRRQFSIASSWNVSPAEGDGNEVWAISQADFDWQGHPGKVELLVALVEYRTNMKITRKGLCSSWLESLAVGRFSSRHYQGGPAEHRCLGTRLPIKISPPTLYLPVETSVPVILVGPGTGVAPMRAFMEERVRQGAAKGRLNRHHILILYLTAIFP